MVSQKNSKDRRQCLISDMDTSTVHSEDLAYGLHFQPNSVPLYFNPYGEQICRPGDSGRVVSSLINHEAWKENSHLGVSYGNGHGLALTLGSHLPTEFQKDRHHVNAANSNMICESEINTGVYNTSNPSSQTLHGMESILTALKNSPYMKPAQRLLDEVVCVSNAVDSGSDKQVRRLGRIATTDGRSPHAGESANRHEGNQHPSDEKHDVHIRISKLVALLDQLESRYEQYFHQIDTVVSSFEAVAGAGAAASYTALTIQAMSKHFSNLRDAIITQLNASRDSLSKDISRSQGHFPHKGSRQRRETLQQLGMIQIRQVWRPLRGLPEESVAHLRSWLFEHFLHPYPTDNEKLILASETGLTRNQISNWFINARVRLWKPMIEEMYREEFAEEDMQD